jgi:hypothetical protein
MAGGTVSLLSPELVPMGPRWFVTCSVCHTVVEVFDREPSDYVVELWTSESCAFCDAPWVIVGPCKILGLPDHEESQ